MEESNKNRIIQPLRKEITDDVLFRKKAEEELKFRQQLIKEIRERIKLSVESNDPAFWKTLRALLGSTDESKY
jgi:hypothetical protein